MSDALQALLPDGWVLTTLGEISSEVKNGISTKPTEAQGLPILRISSVRPGRLDVSDVRFLPSETTGLEAYKLRLDDLLFTRYNGNRDFVGVCARVTLLNRDLFYPDKLIRVRVNESVVVPGYVEKISISPQSRKLVDRKLKTSAGQVGISGADLKELPIPIPPLAEQTRIADKLDTVLSRVDAVNARLARVAPLIKRFRQSVLAAATSGRLTEDWRINQLIDWREVRLADVGEIGRGKSRHRPRNDSALYGGAYPFVQTGDVAGSRGTIRSHSQTYSELGLSQSKLWPANTLCITIAANIADTAVLAYPACFPDSVVGFVADTNKCNVLFVKWVIDVLKNDLERLAPATAQKNINLSALDEVKFLLPPLEEQTEIVRRVETLFAFADRLEARLKAAQTAAQRLTPALLAKAFRGELVPQDPADEPAAELLKRLAAQRAAATLAPRRSKSAC